MPEFLVVIGHRKTVWKYPQRGLDFHSEARAIFISLGPFPKTSSFPLPMLFPG